MRGAPAGATLCQGEGAQIGRARFQRTARIRPAAIRLRPLDGVSYRWADVAAMPFNPVPDRRANRIFANCVLARHNSSRSIYLGDDKEPVVTGDWPEDIAQLALLPL